MITRNPLEGVLSLDELFPSSSEMVHGNSELVKRAFAVIFCSLDLARSTMGTRGSPEVWAVAFLAACYGMRNDGEDANSIRQVARDLAFVTSVPQDIRLYSIFRRIQAAQDASSDPDGFRKRVAAALNMLVDSQQEQTDMFTSEVWACVRDSFAIHERLLGDAGQQIPFMYPASSGLVMRVREFLVDLYTAKFHHSGGESWPEYVKKLWDGAVERTFPYLGLSVTIKESSHEEMDGAKLRDHRVAQAREARYGYPEDFSMAILEEVEKPFMNCSLFHGDANRYRDLIMRQDFNERSYKKQRIGLMKSIRNGVATTVMSRASFDQILQDGEFKSFWQLPEDQRDYTFCDSPQDARALNDIRLFGEKSGRVTYAMLVLPIESDEMVNQNTSHLAVTYGRDTPVMVQLTGHVKESSTISWGDSFQNFVTLPYSDKTLAWLLEARFFLNTLRSHPMAKDIIPVLPKINDLWLSFMQIAFGQKHPYFELQIHGRIGLERIKSAYQASADGGEPVNLTDLVKDTIRNANRQTTTLPCGADAGEPASIP